MPDIRLAMRSAPPEVTQNVGRWGLDTNPVGPELTRFFGTTARGRRLA